MKKGDKERIGQRCESENGETMGEKKREENDFSI